MRISSEARFAREVPDSAPRFARAPSSVRVEFLPPRPAAADCDSNLCLAGHCASICDPVAPTCVPGTTCQATAGSEHVCLPGADDGGGKWCSVGGAGGAGGALAGGLLAFLCTIFAARRRRR